jgi:hypothetical protein
MRLWGAGWVAARGGPLRASWRHSPYATTDRRRPSVAKAASDYRSNEGDSVDGNPRDGDG